MATTMATTKMLKNTGLILFTLIIVRTHGHWDFLFWPSVLNPPQPSTLFFYGIILVCVLTQCLNIHLIFAGCFGTCYLERWQNDAKYFGKS